jgi:hypothetical protein
VWKGVKIKRIGLGRVQKSEGMQGEHREHRAFAESTEGEPPLRALMRKKVWSDLEGRKRRAKEENEWRKEQQGMKRERHGIGYRKRYGKSMCILCSYSNEGVRNGHLHRARRAS